MKISKSSATYRMHLLVATLAILLGQVARAELMTKIDLKGNSYSLSADVSIDYTYGLKDYYSLEEFHSSWQLRSRIDYQIEGSLASYLAKRGTIFTINTQAFNVMRNINHCEPIDIHVLDQALNKDFVRSVFFTHVIGTARMLIWIGENSHMFTCSSSGRYEADLEGGFKVSVVYDSSELTLPLGVPAQVLVEKTGQYTLLYRFKRVVPLKQYQLVFGGSSLALAGHSQPATGTDLLLDIFAIDRALGCAADPKKNANLLDTLADLSHRHRFSFRARYEAEARHEPIEMAVGYEPELEILRTDMTISARSTHTLVAYRENRLYHLTRRRRKLTDELYTNISRMSAQRQAPSFSEDIPCVVMQAKAGSAGGGNPHSLGAMLLGATEVTYLGLANVRGIEAYAFEAHNTEPPVWLEHPSVYEDATKLGTEQMRVSSRFITLTSVFYFTRHSGQNNMILGNKLLLVELFKRHASTGTTLGKVSVPIYDFTWQARAVAPNGERTEDFYSLKDECLAGPLGDNNYAFIELALERAANVSQTPSTKVSAVASHDWLRVGVSRNLALLRALQEQLHVPPTLLNGVESRYDEPQGTRGAPASDLLEVSLRAAERDDLPTRLIFMGRGYLRSCLADQLIEHTALNFQACYQTASNTHRNILFAFNTLDNKCQTYRGEAPTRVNLNQFVWLKPNSPVEIFKVSFQEQIKEDARQDYISKFDDLHQRLADSDDRLMLMDPNKEHPKFQLDTKIYFGFTELQVEHLDEKTAYNLDGQHLDDTNKFPGLGLVAEDSLSKLVVMATSGMTYERCQTGCLVDPMCRSFSTCIFESQVQCVMSEIDFRESTLIIQLMELLEKQSKLAELARVTLNQAGNVTQTIFIRKHPTCELHNKLYENLFTSGGKSIINLQNYRLQPVATSQKCAQICFEKTLEVMRAVHSTQSIEANNISATRCDGYFYLDKQLIKANNLNIKKQQLVGRNVDGATRGYCSFYNTGNYLLQESSIKQEEANKQQQLVQVQNFNFVHLILFESHYGLSLAESSMTSEEHAAYGRASADPSKLARDDLKLIKSFLERGENTGLKFLSNSATGCASRCFTQVDQLWPACRSFEFIELIDKSTADRRSFCLLNTATLKDLQALNRTDMIECDGHTARLRVSPSDKFRVWHYEPRQGYTADSLEQVYRVGLTQRHTLGFKSTKPFHLSSISLFIMLSVVLISGLIMGARLYSPGSNRGCRLPLDREILVESPKTADL